MSVKLSRRNFCTVAAALLIGCAGEDQLAKEGNQSEKNHKEQNKSVKSKIPIEDYYQLTDDVRKL